MNPVAELEDCLRAALSDEREFHGAAVALNIVSEMLRRGMDPAALQSHAWRKDFARPVVDPPSTDDADDTLFALLVVCPRFEFKLETTDPLMHEKMMHAQPKSWLHRLNYARSVVELQDATKLTMTGLSDQCRLDTRRMRELIPLGRVLVVDPELAYRLVNSDIPWSAVKRYFSADRYMRIKDRLHRAWAARAAKRPRPTADQPDKAV